MSKLNLNEKQIGEIRTLARGIAGQVQTYIDLNTTLSVERATLRMMGVDGVDENGFPLVNSLVDHLKPVLNTGSATYLANAVLQTNESPNEIAARVFSGKINLLDMEMGSEKVLEEKSYELCEAQFERIKKQREFRSQKLGKKKEDNRPLLYVIVATGNIYEDVRQARAAARNGADIVAIIRSTAQSLLDYVPHGATTEGFGGTYATQENFSIMRGALDEVGEELGRYIMLVNYASGLCMPEIVVMGALERLDMMLNDSMYGILFRDINMNRTFVDQHFSRMLNSYAGIVINTGEDNYLTTADAYEQGHTVLASDFINEQFAYNSGLHPELMGLGHAFEIDPNIENSFLYELSQAMLIRECFPGALLKYMPPTKHMTGDIFRGYMLNAMYNLAGIWSNQGIQLLGMITEAIHTPHLHDRTLAIENADYVFNAAKSLYNEVNFESNGIVISRANEILNKTEKFLKEVKDLGLIGSIERGFFADIERKPDSGKGVDGVFEKADNYFNPVEQTLRKELKIEEV